MSRTFLFTGPSLHPDLARNLSNATVLPPIKRGDLERLRSLEPETIGIIDGEFYQNLAVTPKEILPFLERGVRVYGASSMGALRAVELHRYGMIGVGRVFRLFRSGILDADDEVALAYSPSTYEALSEPLVNTRYALRAAVRRNVLTRAEAAEAIARLKCAYFPERTRALLLSIVQEIAGKEAVARVRGFLQNGAPNVKEQDARLLIAAISVPSMGASRSAEACGFQASEDRHLAEE
ncbi:MAG: hypothetical protein JO097_05175 [Acidobacteriaceae bacterium]|nr:hypothetical protein [Acidobacteriaceae bacterium]MBV9294923.1 hypothetical protein [Acidobacteriaceae bacterium]MBV9764338.1 hypothetical protein [Acidobacteriaceae bacterium]